MTKQLDETTIANELKGASAFFVRSEVSAEANAVQPDDTTDRITRSDRPFTRPIGSVDRITRSVGSTVRSTVNTSEPTVPPETRTVMDEVYGTTIVPVRAKERYAFEIFSDQKQQIRRIIVLFEQKADLRVSASRIIRDAIEPYLNELEDKLSKS